MTRRDFLQVSSLTLSALVLNACSSGEKIGDSDFKSLKIGYLPIADHLLIIAKELKKSNFIPVKFSSWADLSEAFRSKSIDGALILTPLALKLKSQGLDIKAILAAHRNGSALVVKKGVLQNKDISALKGLKIAIPSRFSTHYLLLGNLLEQGGLTPKDVKLIDMPPTEMIFALNSNSIDAFIVAEPFCAQAEELKIADMFILSHQIINDHICCVLAFHDSVLKQRSDEVSTLLGDFLTTADFINQNPQEASKLSLKFFGQKPALLENLLTQDKRIVYKNLKLQEKDLEQTLQDIKNYEVDTFEIAFKDFVDSTFVDAYLG
ncbi:ABC transporter substrate-binding protein [Helicobacter sp. MIT 11-5569]|uniref:ABC transporter substrate-binding protein n=1 Tax=Helicobacter sp. MIT 11-5569 TaxID=1548151 RepID=UPI0006922E09|nr:ABC transporter substrate-binding protein [Helicobacter sp. MIT 11-5569]TLD81410.1 ABC transporter substrate-binding protein [Helicobacter sp. MIT 11-5569]